MDFEEVVMSRQSVRGYKTDPIPKELIEEIISLAKRAPSSMNTQPWHVHVLTGVADEVRTRNMTEMSKGAPQKRDIPHGQYEGDHRFRQVAIAKKLFGAMGIAREDKEGRQDWVLRDLDNLTLLCHVF